METDLLQAENRLFDQLINPFYLTLGWADVAKNKGAPGIDSVTTTAFQDNLDQELSQLAEELAIWTYKPKPVKHVEIDKPDGGVRLLGIPCVRDSVVQATLKRLLEPLLTPTFSDQVLDLFQTATRAKPLRRRNG